MLPEYVKFYYDKLPEIKKAVYMQMYKGLREHKKRIIINTDTSIISSDDLMYIFKCLYNDTPSFYFVDLSLCKFIKIPTGYVFIKDFIYFFIKVSLGFFVDLVKLIRLLFCPIHLLIDKVSLPLGPVVLVVHLLPLPLV